MNVNRRRMARETSAQRRGDLSSRFQMILVTPRLHIRTIVLKMEFSTIKPLQPTYVSPFVPVAILQVVFLSEMAKSAYSDTIPWALFVICCCFASGFFFFFSTEKTKAAINARVMYPSRGASQHCASRPFLSKSHPLNLLTNYLISVTSSPTAMNNERESSDHPLWLRRIDSVMCRSPAISRHFKLQGFIFNAYLLSSPMGSFYFSSVWKWLGWKLMKIKIPNHAY